MSREEMGMIIQSRLNEIMNDSKQHITLSLKVVWYRRMVIVALSWNQSINQSIK